MATRRNAGLDATLGQCFAIDPRDSNVYSTEPNGCTNCTYSVETTLSLCVWYSLRSICLLASQASLNFRTY